MASDRLSCCCGSAGATEAGPGLNATVRGNVCTMLAPHAAGNHLLVVRYVEVP